MAFGWCRVYGWQYTVLSGGISCNLTVFWAALAAGTGGHQPRPPACTAGAALLCPVRCGHKFLVLLAQNPAVADMKSWCWRCKLC